MKKEELEKLYLKYSAQEIADANNLKRHQVNYLIKKYGIKNTKLRKRKYCFNESYFKIINTKVKAYFLGLITADGSIHKNGKTITVGLLKEDKYLLDILATELHYKNPNYYLKSNNVIELNICSKKLVKSLLTYNLSNNKSFNTSLPNVKYTLSFLKGLFDGDGYIKNQIVLSTSSTQLQTDIINYCLTNYSFKPSLIQSGKALLFNKDSKIFINDMMLSTNIGLKRKLINFNHYWRINKT